MRKAEAIQILGNPSRIDMQVACPHCSERAMAFSDGSIMCIMEGGACFEPESTDEGHPCYGPLLKLRKQFDAANGITVSDRLLLPGKVLGRPVAIGEHVESSASAAKTEAGDPAEGGITADDRALFLNAVGADSGKQFGLGTGRNGGGSDSLF